MCDECRMCGSNSDSSAFSIQHSELLERPVAAHGRRSRWSPAARYRSSRRQGTDPSTAGARRRPGRLPGRERERRVLLADDRSAHERRGARAGDGLGDLARGARRSALRCARRVSASAPLATSDRCEVSLPKASRLSKTHCIDRPGSPTKGSSITRRSYHRLTVTIGFDVIAPASATSRRQRRRRRLAKSVRMPNHGTAEIDVSRQDALAAHVDAVIARSIRQHARERARAHLPAAALDEGAAPVPRTSACSGRIGSAIAEAGAIRPEHLGQHSDERRRARLVRRLIERREGQRLPQPVRQLPVWPWRAASSRPSCRRRSRHPPGRARARARAPQRRRHPQDRQRDRATAARPTQHAAEQMQRRRQRRTLEHRAAARRDRGTARCSAGCSRTFRRADPSQKREGLGVAAEQDVLPVVDELAGVRDRGTPSPVRRAAAAPRARARGAPRVGERGRGAQPGKTAADDDDVGRHADRGVATGSEHCRAPSEPCASR